MYFTYLLGLFFILGIDGGSSDGNVFGKRDSLDFHNGNDVKSHVVRSNVTLTSRQIAELEKTLNSVFKHFFGSPGVKLSLRSSDDGTSGLGRTIWLIGERICDHVRNVFKRFGINLYTRIGSYQFIDTKSLSLSLYYNLMRIPLEIKPVWEELYDRMNKFAEKANYENFGYKKTKFSTQFYDTHLTNDSKIPGIMSAIKTYTVNVYICLEDKKSTSFDLKKAVGKLTKYSPEMTGKILKKRLERPLPKFLEAENAEYDQFHALVCHATTENLRAGYRNCLKEVKRISECVDKKLNQSLSGVADNSAGEPPKNFIRTIKTLDESCRQVRGKFGFSIECRVNKNVARNDDFSYIVDFFAGDLKKSATLSRMVNDLGATLRKSQIGAETLREISTYVRIYQKGLEKNERFMKSAQNGARQRFKLKKMTENLSEYKRHMARMTFKTIGNVNEVVSTVEKVLADSSSKVSSHDLSANVKALKCWSDLMEAIFGNWINGSGTFGPQPVTPRPNGQLNLNTTRRYKAENEVGFVRNSHDEPLNKFIDSMKRLSQTPAPRRSSALISLANTFLLATMFYECISVLAGAIYREDSVSVSPSTSVEIDDNDQWPPRDRRSPFLVDHQDHSIPKKENDESFPRTTTNIDIISSTSQSVGKFYRDRNRRIDSIDRNDFFTTKIKTLGSKR